MNKKILSIIALGATVSCALATGAFAGHPEFIRSSSRTSTVTGDTKDARTTSLRPAAAVAPALMSAVAADADEPVILIDKAPAFQEKISSYVVNDVDNDNYTWTIENNTWDAYSFLEIYPYYNGNNLNDWVFIPFEVPEGGGRLSLSMLASTSYSDGHSFKVCIGKDSTPDAMTAVLASCENYGTGGLGWNTVKEPVKGSATVTDSGKYWLGIQATSNKDAYKLRIRDILLTLSPATVTPPAPVGEVFSMHPTEEEFRSCTVIDGNSDGCLIHYDVHEGTDGTVYDWPIAYNNRTTPSATADADEWIITPAVTLTETDRLYTASIYADPTSTSTTESFRIVMAKAADIESMRAGAVVMSEPAVSGSDYQAFTSKFGITEPGEYYFGIHINSPLENGWRLMLRDFTVSLTDLSSAIPGSCTGLTLAPDPSGALQFTAEFDLPATYINGTQIPASQTVEAEISTGTVTETVSGTPGQHIARTVRASDGSNVVTVTSFNENGRGIEVKGVVVCGIGVPTDPVVTSTVSDDNMSITLKWDPVTQGADGAVSNPETTVYNIYQYTITENVGQWVRFSKDLTECSFTFTATDTTQQLYQFMVSARNEKGESQGAIESFAAAMLGTPHEIPVSETFPGKQMKYAGLLIDYPDENYTAEWALDNPSAVGATDGPEAALMCVTINADGVGYGYVELPKISTVGCTAPRIRLLTHISSLTPETIVRIHSTEGRGNGEILGNISSASGNGWTEITYNIPERYQNKNWIVISLDVKCTTLGQAFVLGEYRVSESVADDLAMTQLSMPSYVYLGDDIQLRATLQNRGTNSAVTPELNAVISLDGESVNTVALTCAPATLTENQTAEYTGTLHIGKADMAEQDFTVKVTIPGTDSDLSNNTVSGAFRVGLGDLPVTADLQADGTRGDKNVYLSWSDPFAGGYVDRIESYAHGCHDYNLGEWKNIDFDKAYTYTSENFDIPDPGTPKAFQSVNSILSGIEVQGGMGQPSGDSFLMAFSPQEAEADDWLISPMVNGGSTLSFFITSLSGYYTERVEVMVSATDDDLDSFSTLDRFDLNSAGWAQYSCSLPDDTKYFAIHYISNDMFGICIDDIAYTPALPTVEITGWNIYRDGKLICSDNPSTLFTDQIPDLNSTYTYNVAATGTRKGVAMEFPLSATVKYANPASVNLVDANSHKVTVEKGSVTIEGCSDRTVEITDLRGATVSLTDSAPERMTVSLAPGFYIVTVDGKANKVLIP